MVETDSPTADLFRQRKKEGKEHARLEVKDEGNGLALDSMLHMHPAQATPEQGWKRTLAKGSRALNRRFVRAHSR